MHAWFVPMPHAGVQADIFFSLHESDLAQGWVPEPPTPPPPPKGQGSRSASLISEAPRSLGPRVIAIGDGRTADVLPPKPIVHPRMHVHVSMHAWYN